MGKVKTEPHDGLINIDDKDSNSDGKDEKYGNDQSSSNRVRVQQ